VVQPAAMSDGSRTHAYRTGCLYAWRFS